jgi:hypothetical protein
MATSISAAFIAQYEGEVHQAYQQRGSKLRNTVRLKTGVVGSTCYFPKTGKGVAGLKTRHGNVPIMNVDHSQVSASMADYYGADYVDKLDELKFNFDDRQVLANAGAWALGRKFDDLCFTAMDGTSTTVAEGSAGLTKDKILEAFEDLNDNDVPDDGNRFCVVGAHQWNELLNITEFKSADYAGTRYPWLKGTESRVWLNTTWIFHTGLPLSTGTRKCFMYHQSAIGVGEGTDVKAYIDWVPEKAAFLIDHMMSMGAVLIDANGVVEISCDDDAAIS